MLNFFVSPSPITDIHHPFDEWKLFLDRRLPEHTHQDRLPPVPSEDGTMIRRGCELDHSTRRRAG